MGDCDRSVNLDFYGSTHISNVGLLAHREPDQVFALTTSRCVLLESILTRLSLGS